MEKITINEMRLLDNKSLTRLTKEKFKILAEHVNECAMFKDKVNIICGERGFSLDKASDEELKEIISCHEVMETFLGNVNKILTKDYQVK